MEQPPNEATAYHEAGHAVVALELGRPVAYVSALPGRLFLGTCAFGKPVFRPSEDWLEREMLIALAGPAAEARHTGVYCWEGGGRDLAFAESLARERADGDRQAARLLRRMLAKTEHLLHQEDNWDAVERLAAELRRLGEISGRAARHLFEESRRKRR